MFCCWFGIFFTHEINNQVFNLTAVVKVCRNERGTGVGRGRKSPNLGHGPCPLLSLVHFSGKHPVIEAGSESKGRRSPCFGKHFSSCIFSRALICGYCSSVMKGGERNKSGIVKTIQSSHCF